MTKKITLVLFIFSLISCNTKNQINPDNYIELVYFKDKNDNKILSRIQSQIKNSNDSIGTFINGHKPRFGYFLLNKLELNTDSLKQLYPDTIAIKKIFLKQINEKQFLSNFSKLALENQEHESYSVDEIIKVASRFFVVVVNSRNEFRLKICGGGNEFQDLNAIKDISLLEALTYEAIISAFEKKKNERPKFISNARIYFSDIIKNPDSLSNSILLESAKNNLYKMMEKDKSLRLFISNYLTDNSDNLPFEIKK
ncbi:hypothetical protein [Maribacter sp. 2304DJ31-5]|uniref:hypothetical protein n=1 Tax=Maribacter sp. 2304DJ31-5 TaxID=3386273 RepID=UPI0039BC7D71